MAGQKVYGWRDLLNKDKGGGKGQDTTHSVGEDIKIEENDNNSDSCKDMFGELEAFIAKEHQDTRLFIFSIFNKKRRTEKIRCIPMFNYVSKQGDIRI